MVEPHLLPEEAAVMNGGQVSVVDLDELVQVLGFLHLVLKLKSSTVQNLSTQTERKYTVLRSITDNTK